jgi:hypothetical protein
MRSRLARIVDGHPDRIALALIAAAVIVANGVYLLGVFDANPLGPRSGLIASQTAGRLVGLPTIDPSNGFISQALGHRAMLDWVHLQIPWWNPFEATGSPLAGEMESAALFPLTAFTLLSNGQLYEHLLLELLSGGATYLLFRRLAISQTAATAGGVVFALNGTFAWFAHAPVNPIAFLPLLLLGVELAYSATTGGEAGGWWLIAIAAALSIYAGFPEVTYIDGVLAIVWAAWRCGCATRPQLRAFLAKLVAGGAGALLLSAPLLIAFADYLGHADTGSHASGAFGSVHLASQALPALVLPYVYGPIFAFTDPKQILTWFWGGVGGYLSTSLVLLALLGLLSGRRRGLRVVLALWIVLVLARTYGVPPVLGHVLGVLPDMSQVAFFRYSWPALEFAVLVLAVLGLDQVIAAPARPRRAASAAAVVGACIVAAVLGARPLTRSLGHAFSEHPFFRDAIVWGVGIAVLALAASLLQRTRFRRAVIVAVFVLDAGALFVVPELSAPKRVTVDMAPVAYLRQHLGNGRFFTLAPFAPNYGSYFGLSELDINDVPVPSGFKRYVRASLAPYADPLLFVGFENSASAPSSAPSPEQELVRYVAGYRAAAVNYVLATPGTQIPQSPTTFQLVDRTPSTWIYHLSGSAPYFTAKCVVASQTKESLHVNCPRPTELIKRELYLPGWHAEVDGKSVPVHSTNQGFQEIRVGNGRHRIAFSYTPPNVDLGIVALVLGIAWMLAGAGLRRRRQSARR